ncbi:unnamed protein product [Cochlearia groenlandica]
MLDKTCPSIFLRYCGLEVFVSVRFLKTSTMPVENVDVRAEKVETSEPQIPKEAPPFRWRLLTLRRVLV